MTLSDIAAGGMIAGDGLLAAAEALAGDITALRRAIHAEPEIGLDTPATIAKLRAALADLDLEWRSGPSTSGAVAVLKGRAPAGRAARRVLLRADTDALPLTEETGLPFASRIAGRMHACGHDAHSAMLAGTARMLAERDDWAGEVLLMFQPGEEGFHGARLMLEDGLIDPLPDAAFALHVMPDAPHGMVAGRAGPLMAASDRIEITVAGRGGHASMPHAASDPLPVACEIVTGLQTMITRQFDAGEPAVVTIAQIEAGHAENVIADACTMRGTMRTLSAATRQRLAGAVERLASHVAAAHGLTAEVRIEAGFPVTVNDPRAAALGEAVTRARFGDSAWQTLERPLMTAEDFSYLLEMVPGAMFFLGVAHEGEDWTRCCGLHSPRMILDESVLPRGAALLAGLALATLADGLPEGATGR